MGQHHRRPQDARGLPRRRHRHRLGRRHPAALRALDRHRRPRRRRPRDRRPDGAPDLRARCRARRRRLLDRGPEGQEDRLQPRPGPGRARAQRAARGRPHPGRRRARRDAERRRRVLRGARRQAGRRRPARPVAGEDLPREVRARRRHHDRAGRARRRLDALHPHRGPRGRRQGGRDQGLRRRLGRGPGVDLQPPRRVRPGLLRRPRGPLGGGRGLRRRGARRVHRPDELGRLHRAPPGDRRHPRRGAGPRPVDVETLYDRRYEKAIAAALDGKEAGS